MTLRDPTFDLPTVHKVLAVGGYPYMQPNTRPQPRRTQDQGMTYRVSFSTAPMQCIEEAHAHKSRNASEFSRKPRESSAPHTNAHLFPPWHQPHPPPSENSESRKKQTHISIFFNPAHPPTGEYPQTPCPPPSHTTNIATPDSLPSQAPQISYLLFSRHHSSAGASA